MTEIAFRLSLQQTTLKFWKRELIYSVISDSILHFFCSDRIYFFFFGEIQLFIKVFNFIEYINTLFGI